MKLKRSEKIWLAVVVIFYILYNLPFIPGYGNSQGTLVHALLTLVPLWISVYAGLARSFKDYPLKDTSDHADKEEE